MNKWSVAAVTLSLLLPVLSFAQGAGTSGGSIVLARSADCASKKFAKHNLGANGYEDAYNELVTTCLFTDEEAKCLIKSRQQGNTNQIAANSCGINQH